MPDVIVREPIYQQLNQVLRDLAGREFKGGDQFLTEREVADRFGVSRATANKALAALVAEGIVEFRKGLGTFVRGDVLDYDLRALVSFTDKAVTAGKKPATRVLRFETVRAVDANDDAAARLALSQDDELFYVERLRLADRVPVILERRYIVARLCPGLSKSACAKSLYALWTDRYKLSIEGADETIRAVLIQKSDAGLLEVNPGIAGLLVTSVGYLEDGAPLWYEHTLYRGDAYEFHNRLGPIRTARPAAGTLLDLDAPGS